MILDNSSKARKTLTPKEKLIRRINREFPKKKFIGDIPIDDDEYEILNKLLLDGYKMILHSYSHVIIDPVFATALVQVGIRKYDGNYWRYIKEILKPYNLNSNQHKWIGDSFYATLKKYNKILLGKGEIVNNILLHSFVVDNYANEFFEFLFAYYRIDLDRDLGRYTREMMNSLIEIIMRNDNTDRTYLIRTNTQQAVTNNIRGCKIRIRRYLRLIDNSFWGQEVLLNLNNRMSRLFNEWKENSDEFKDEVQRNYGLGLGRGGKKRFTSPYLKCNLKNTSFSIQFPSQIVKASYPDNVYWRLKIGENHTKYCVDVYKVITGYKTEELTINLDSSDLFKSINLELMENDNRLRIFKINNDSIRFFDKDGDFLFKDKLPEEEVYSFTEGEYTPVSDSLIDSERIGQLVKSYFELENGDIIRLPDGRPLSIGKRIDEGLLHRGCLMNICGVYQSREYKIYNKVPTILMKIPSNKTKGTLIKINDNRYRMFDVNTTVLDINEGNGETGYLINLVELGVAKDGLYNIYIDVPNDRTNRSWQFFLINGLKFEFEDAPYIFKDKGTIKFNEQINLKPNRTEVEKTLDENSFNFRILPLEDELVFLTEIEEKDIELLIEIPVFKWSLNKEDWYIQQPSEIWHHDFQNKIYFKYPENKLVLNMDDLSSGDEEQSVAYSKGVGSGIFECDVTRFKSWFGREKKLRTLYLNINNNEYEFMRIITRSYVTDKIIIGDFINNKLIGEFEIVGNSNYYVDIFLGNTKIADKEAIIDGKVTISNPLLSGRYRVVVFEEESDDTGFGDSHYLHMFEFYQDLVNPYNLTGSSVQVNHLKRYDSVFKTQLTERYYIKDIKSLSCDDKSNYLGYLIKGSNDNLLIPVKIRINDINKLNQVFIYFIEDEEDIEFLLDSYKNRIVRFEKKGLKSSVRYRRYTVVYEDEYIYGIDFI